MSGWLFTFHIKFFSSFNKNDCSLFASIIAGFAYVPHREGPERRFFPKGTLKGEEELRGKLCVGEENGR